MEVRTRLFSGAIIGTSGEKKEIFLLDQPPRLNKKIYNKRNLPKAPRSSRRESRRRVEESSGSELGGRGQLVRSTGRPTSFDLQAAAHCFSGPLPRGPPSAKV